MVERLLRGVRDADIAESLSYREPGAAALADQPAPDGVGTEATPVPADPRASISQAGYDFVVRWETGGKAYYESVIRGRPVWPGYSSGITIGCGFDLGYHTPAEFSQQWQSRLPATEFQRLAQTIGFKTVAPNRDAKVVKARQLVASLSDITVSWAVAIEQFDKAKLPRLIRQLFSALDNLDRLHPHSRSALLSLVFNRGPAFTASDDRYREMRAIAKLMRQGDAVSFRRIPVELRAMKRIWGEQSSLAERREGEAQLFLAGLEEQRLLESLTAPVETEAAEMELPGRAGELLDDLAIEQSDDADEALLLEGAGEAGLEAAVTIGAVRWNPDDRDQPDYAHLDLAAAGSAFTVMGEDIDALIEANAFKPLQEPIVLAIRGAALASGDRENVASLDLIDQRPDHREFRCVIGVFHPSTRRFSAYRASTVPNAQYVLNCFDQARAGTPLSGLTGNILPTGCYTFTVGTHKKNKPGEIPGVLRLSTTATGASAVVVQRSLSDVVYDRSDVFVVATPGDNIHPGILNVGFSSAGCLTLPGRFTGGQHVGVWQRFRKAAGIDGAPDGEQRSALLLTGLDFANAARLRAGSLGKPSLRRLRHGSQGERVKALQRALGLQPDARGIFGPLTRKALCERQAEVLGGADGIYSPEMDARLGFTVYAGA
ncbi:hypothetical protein DWF00_22260 [Bosea caraganae]|uniref:Peptidoglycan-binding protein n=1 Tax=Bosea caraganae TaxID=2763117 RepID=A0A370L5H7_9HYPH|nr:hypothetical protein DWF00_22260 [Bosea caraganae]RDJ24532.1 hypothetical protein DWE98_12635 [Bosea caraganae]